MKAFKKIVLGLFCYVIFISCHKQTLPPSTVLNQPVFSFTGTLGGNNLNIQAGLNNYYMYSSYSQDTSGVYSFIGTLQNTSTTNSSIQIIINDCKVSKQNASVSTHIDTALATTIGYGYNKGVTTISDTTYKVTFTPRIFAGTPLSYNYVFGDGGTSSLPSPTHTYTSVANYNTSLTINFAICGAEIMTNTYKGINQVSALKIDSITSTVGAKHSDTTLVAMKGWASGGTGPYTYSWVLGDGKTSTLSSFVDTNVNKFDSNHINHLTYSCILNATDHLGATATYNYTVVDTVDNNICRFDYLMSKPTRVITSTNTLPFSAVTIIYTDPNGKVYTSKNASQPGSSNFKITSVSDYQPNLNNQATKMLKVTFNCTMYPLSGPSIQATGCTAIIAVAYK